jgi:H+/gluconate symporter-like permease
MKLFEKLKHEFLQVLPPMVFFFIAFILLVTTDRLIQREYGIPPIGYGVALIGALLVAKVVLIFDHLSFMNKFSGKPLIFNIAWKSTLYFAGAFLARYIEHIFPFLREYKNLSEAHQHLMAELVWPHFWVVQIWLAVLFLIYCTFQELIRAIGRNQFIRLFLG